MLLVNVHLAIQKQVCSNCFHVDIGGTGQHVHVLQRASLKQSNLLIHQLLLFAHFVWWIGSMQEPQRKQNLEVETNSCGTKELKKVRGNKPQQKTLQFSYIKTFSINVNSLEIKIHHYTIMATYTFEWLDTP